MAAEIPSPLYRLSAHERRILLNCCLSGMKFSERVSSSSAQQEYRLLEPGLFAHSPMHFRSGVSRAFNPSGPIAVLKFFPFSLVRTSAADSGFGMSRATCQPKRLYHRAPPSLYSPIFDEFLFWFRLLALPAQDAPRLRVECLLG